MSNEALLAASAVEALKVTTLQHEVLDDAVKDGSLVSKTLFSAGQCSKVGCSLGHVITCKDGILSNCREKLSCTYLAKYTYFPLPKSGDHFCGVLRGIYQ